MSEYEATAGGHQQLRDFHVSKEAGWSSMTRMGDPTEEEKMICLWMIKNH